MSSSSSSSASSSALKKSASASSVILGGGTVASNPLPGPSTGPGGGLVTPALPTVPAPPVATPAFSLSSLATPPPPDLSHILPNVVLDSQPPLNRYLHRRRYFPSSRGAANGSCSVFDYALRQVLSCSVNNSDALAFSLVHLDPVSLEQQYHKFKLWIAEAPDLFKPELAQLLYPVFTHLFLELVSTGQKTLAQKFHKRHQATFVGNCEFNQFIRQLAPLLTPEDIHRDEQVSAYHSNKYNVTLSNRTFKFLLRYLQSCQGPPILLHILRSRLEIKIGDAHGAYSKSESHKRSLHDHKLEEQEEEMRKKKRSSLRLLDGLQADTAANHPHHHQQPQPVQHQAGGLLQPERVRDIVKTVREGPPPLPTSSLFRLTNYHSSFTCSTINPGGSCLAAGADNSSIQIFNLLPSPKSGSWEESSSSSNSYYHCSAAAADAVSSSSSSSKAKKSFRSHQKTFLASDKIFARARQRYLAESYRESDCRSEVMDDNESSWLDTKCLVGHRGSVYGVAYMPNNTDYLLSCGEDTTLRIWDVETESNKAVYEGHSYPVWCLDVDRLGIYVATGSMDRTAKLWHLEYTHPLRIFAGHERDVDCIQFHPNCNYLATGSIDKSVRMWTHTDAKMVRVFPGHKGAIYSVSFSPDGKLLASAGEDRRIKIWDLAASKVLKDLRGHTDTVHSLTWTADSSLLASGGLDGSVRLWDVNASGSRDFGDENAGNSNCSVEQVACYGGTLCENVNDLRYSRQGTLLVTGFSNSVGREAALSAAVAKTAAASVAAAASNNGQQQQQQLFHQQNPTVKVIKSEPMMNGGGGGGIGD